MSLSPRRSESSSRVLALAFVCTMLGLAPLGAQETGQAQQQAPSAPQQGSGLLNEIGRLLKSPADLLPSLSKSEPQSPPAQEPPAPVQTAPAPAPAKQPPASVAAPPPSTPAPPVAEPAPAAASARSFPGMANGREACPVSANGAPDCQSATDRLCQSKGYKSGKSLSTDSAYTCSARLARGEGRKPCGTEHYVTSAFCQ